MLLASRLARPPPISPGISAEPTGPEAAVAGLLWRALASTRWPSLEPFGVLALETGSLQLVTGRSLATKRRAAREASRAPLQEREVVQEALVVLAFSQRPLAPPLLC